MDRGSAGFALLLLAIPAWGQEPASVYQTQKAYQFKADLLVRQEWTKDLFAGDDQNRRRAQLRPRLEISFKKISLGVGGEFNYSSDKNYDPPPTLIRDNYRSRDARVDLAFLDLKPFSWLELQGGRFFMPVGLTEMIWDKDLRPQGAALTLQTQDLGSVKQLGLTALVARGSHVFGDDHVNMYMGSGEITFASGRDSTFQIVGSYVEFRDLQTMEEKIRRQNTRVLGQLVNRYQVVDGVARLRVGGVLPLQLVADFCWNIGVSDNRRGIWLAGVLGSLKDSRLRAEYTYARVDKDATLAAYATDDFFWSTGWEGHRLDLGSKLNDQSSFHIIGQLQRFKDSPRPEERDHWVKRYRVETRYTF